MMHFELTLTDGKLWYGTEPVGCHLFAMCDRQAETLHDAGALGTLPACQRCADKLNELA
jgi:hypothetical protein